jgi:assimilatory nitrate reductase catalytic subunit
VRGHGELQLHVRLQGRADFAGFAQRLDFLVVQDMYYNTETAQMAHLVLPAAAWGEKEGTFINSERRFGVVRPVCRAPGQALSDFRIFQLVAEYWGCSKMFRKWKSPADVFQLLKRLTAGQPCDISSIDDYEMLDRCGGIQWPLAENAGNSATHNQLANFTERRLFEDGQFFHADGRARFVCEPPHAWPEPPSQRFPFILLTGRGTAAQ